MALKSAKSDQAVSLAWLKEQARLEMRNQFQGPVWAWAKFIAAQQGREDGEKQP